MTIETKNDLRRGLRHLGMAMRHLDNFDFKGARNQMSESRFFLDKVAREVKMNGEDVEDDDE